MIDTTTAIVERIVAQGIGVDTGTGTNVFHSRLPSAPANAICVKALGGRRADRAFGTSTPPVRENPDVQLMVRNATIDGMIAVLSLIRAAFDFKEWTATGGDRFFSQFAYEPVDSGEDENRNELMSVVLDIKRERL